MTNEEKLKLIKQVTLDYDEYNGGEKTATDFLTSVILDIIAFGDD